MSTNWYPEIDIEQCNNCKICIDVCAENVFDTSIGKTIVSYSEECIWQCTKCQSQCPQNAIYYVLDLDRKLNSLEQY